VCNGNTHRSPPAEQKGASRPAAPGDHPALALVYRDHAGAVFGLAQYLCGPELAEDVTHSVFVRWWRDSGSVDVPPRSLRITLLALAYEHALDLVPAMSRRPAGPGMLAVEHLPEIERDAIATAVLGQCSYQDAAAILGQTEESVRARILAGLRRLHRRADADLNP
jgi:DNA-directed RNA polymerase specialized sigma24 family protein